MSNPINRLQQWFRERGRERWQRARLRWFERAWEMLAQRHLVDGLGGAEHQRIRQEWESAGYPFPVASFIRRRANQVPPPSAPDNHPEPEDLS